MKIAERGRSEQDSGWSWVIAACCFFIDMMIRGMMRLGSQFFVSTIQSFPVSRSQAALPYTLNMAFRDFVGPVAGYLCQRLGLRFTTSMGCILSTIGIALCFTATGVTHLIIYYGFIFGIGFGFVISLLPIAINWYFNKYRAIANGIAFSGSCIGSFILPPFYDFLISQYGLNGTFLILSGLVLNCLPATVLLRKPNFETMNVSKDIEGVPEPQIDSTTIHDSTGADGKEYPLKGSQGKLNSPTGYFRTQVNEKVVLNVSHPNDESDQRGKTTCCCSEDVIKDLSNTNTVSDNEGLNCSNDINQRSVAGKSGSDSIFRKLLKLFMDPMYIFFLLNSAFIRYSFFTIITIMIDFSLDVGVEQGISTFVILSFSAGDLIGRLGLGWTIDVGLLSISTYSALCYLLQGIILTAFAFVSSFWSFMLVVSLLGLFESAIFVIQPLVIAEFVDKDLQTLAIPSNNVVACPVSLLIYPTIRYFREYRGSYVDIFYLLGGLHALFCIIWFYISYRNFHNKK